MVAHLADDDDLPGARFFSRGLQFHEDGLSVPDQDPVRDARGGRAREFQAHAAVVRRALDEVVLHGSLGFSHVRRPLSSGFSHYSMDSLGNQGVFMEYGNFRKVGGGLDQVATPRSSDRYPATAAMSPRSVASFFIRRVRFRLSTVPSARR